MSKRQTSVGDGSDAQNRTAVPLVEAAAKASDLRTLPDGASEFCRMADLRRLFGITRATAYQLANAGRIRTVSLRQRGQARGVRLVNVASVRAYLEDLLARQGEETEAGHE